MSFVIRINFKKNMFEINTTLHIKALDTINKKVEKEYKKIVIMHNRIINKL